MSDGKLIQVMGPVVDVEFSEGDLPEIFTALAISNPAIDDTEGNLIVEVALHLGDNMVRCVAMDITDGLVRDMPVKNTGKPILMPAGDPTLGRVLNVVGRPVDGPGLWARIITAGVSVMPARLNASTIKQNPPPEVAVMARAPAKLAPMTMLMAAISSSACSTMMLYLSAWEETNSMMGVAGDMG